MYLKLWAAMPVTLLMAPIRNVVYYAINEKPILSV